MTSRLQGRVAVISGGSSGIGLAIAQRFVEEGAHVVIFARRRQTLDDAAKLIGDSHVTTIQADAANVEDLERVAAEVKAQHGKVDVVVASAGITEKFALPEITPAHFDKVFNLNARGPLFLVQKMLPMMGQGGSIILIGSAIHGMGLATHSAYAATKAATRSFVRTWAAELKDSGIRANNLSSGVVDTPMLDDQCASPDEAEQLRAGYRSHTPMGRLGRPQELANAALFLASDEGSFMTGADLVCDGGISAVCERLSAEN